MELSRRVIAELIGTALLLAIVVGSGIMGQQLAGGNVALALIANTGATVAGLYVLIELFGPVSGAHFNPLVSAVMALRGSLAKRELPVYVAAQLAGAVLGTWLAHAMFDLHVLQLSTKLRSSGGLWISEAVATAGLVLVVLRAPAGRAAGLVAAYIGAAYWFTASTSFANPAAVVGRMLTDTFAGIAPASSLAFVAAQVVGAAFGMTLADFMDARVAPRVAAAVASRERAEPQAR